MVTVDTVTNAPDKEHCFMETTMSYSVLRNGSPTLKAKALRLKEARFNLSKGVSPKAQGSNREALRLSGTSLGKLRFSLSHPELLRLPLWEPYSYTFHGEQKVVERGHHPPFNLLP
jgi:hypothetical protein